MGYIDQQGNYHEGDKQLGDIEVPKRPSLEHTWQNGEWVIGKKQQYDKINATYSTQLSNVLTAITQANARGDAAAVIELQETYSSINADWKAKLLEV